MWTNVVFRTTKPFAPSRPGLKKIRASRLSQLPMEFASAHSLRLASSCSYHGAPFHPLRAGTGLYAGQGHLLAPLGYYDFPLPGVPLDQVGAEGNSTGCSSYAAGGHIVVVDHLDLDSNKPISAADQAFGGHFHIGGTHSDGVISITNRDSQAPEGHFRGHPCSLNVDVDVYAGAGEGPTLQANIDGWWYSGVDGWYAAAWPAVQTNPPVPVMDSWNAHRFDVHVNAGAWRSSPLQLRDRDRGVTAEQLLDGLLRHLPLAGDSSVTWVTFHGDRDLGFLLRLLQPGARGGGALPSDRAAFMRQVREAFPIFYDVRVLGQLVNKEGFRGSLTSLAELLGVRRVGGEHHAGSDALLTMSCFSKILRSSQHELHRLDSRLCLLSGMEEFDMGIKCARYIDDPEVKTVKVHSDNFDEEALWISEMVTSNFKVVGLDVLAASPLGLG